MPAKDDELAQLRARVEQLEALLTARREPTDLTADEIAAYHKVSGLLAADWGDFCGINDCYRPVFHHCYTACFRCITRCINECISECNIMPPMGVAARRGGLARFES